jgi:hypothetical protein
MNGFRNESDDCDPGFIYEEDQTLYFACCKEAVTAKLLTSWFTGKAYQIENRSSMVDHAVTWLTMLSHLSSLPRREMS